jgi:gluconolactonase
VAWSFERVAGPFEGPAAGLAWDGRAMLFCVLSPGVRAGEGRILRFDPATGEAGVFRAFTNRTSALAFGPDGALYGCQSLSRRVVRFDSEGSTSLTATRIDGRYHNVPGSLAIDSRGRIWFSDAPRSDLRTSGPHIFPRLEPASVLLLEKNSSGQWVLKRVASDVSEPAAVALSPDEKTLYVSDGAELRAYAVENEGLEGGRRLHALPGPIKGLCVARNGDVLACAGPAILVLSPSGALRESHAFPGEPMHCAFGGAELYVTTAAGELWRRK